MNKGELIDAVADATGQSKAAVGGVIDATLDAITATLSRRVTR